MIVFFLSKLYIHILIPTNLFEQQCCGKHLEAVGACNYIDSYHVRGAQRYMRCIYNIKNWIYCSLVTNNAHQNVIVVLVFRFVE